MSGTPARAADWLGLAAAPTFAAMALLTGIPGGHPDMLAGHASPLSGMVPMYALMSAFHCPHWLRLVCRHRRLRPDGERDDGHVQRQF